MSDEPKSTKSQAVESAPSPDQAQLLELNTDDYQQTGQTVNTFLGHRNVIAAAAERIVQAEPGRMESAGDPLLSDKCSLAVKLLSAIREPKAVTWLLRIIDVRAKSPLDMEVERRLPTVADPFPAAWALARIGKPSIEQCRWQLTKKNSAKRRQLFCWVIGQVEGPEVGRYVLKLGIDQETDPQRKARLREALPILEKLFPLEELAPAK